MEWLQDEAQHTYDTRLGSKEIVEVSGSITRLYTSTAWLETDDGKETFEVRFPKEQQPALGEQWRFRGFFREILQPTTPGAFDRRTWLKRYGIVCQLVALEGQCLGVGNFKSRLYACSQNIRQSISNILSENGTRTDVPTQIMISILLGEKRALPDEIMDDFRTSGTLHIFAVSGLHVGIATGLVLLVFYFIPIHPIRVKLLSIILLGIYVFITGMPVSAIRAYTMIVLLIASLCLRKAVQPLNTLSLAALLVLLTEPRQLFDPGFQLSFFIFGAIVVASAWGQKERPWWAPDPFIPPSLYTQQERFLVRQERTIRLFLLVSFASWLVSIPLTISHFGTFNMYSTLANLLMSPFLAPLMGCSMACALTFWLPWLSELFAACARFTGSILLATSQFVANQPHSLIPWSMQAEPPHAIALALPSQGHCIILGNPGIVVNCGNEYAARQIVTPALRTCGFTPRYLVQTQKAVALNGGVEQFKNLWPNLKDWSTPEQPAYLQRLVHQRSGSFVIFNARQDFASGLSADKTPVILWECQGKRLLYVGNAAMSSLLLLPQQQLHADILLIGFNSHDPVDDSAWIQSTGASEVVFLGELPQALTHLPTGVQAYSLQTNKTLEISMDTSPSVSVWMTEEESP